MGKVVEKKKKKKGRPSLLDLQKRTLKEQQQRQQQQQQPQQKRNGNSAPHSTPNYRTAPATTTTTTTTDTPATVRRSTRRNPNPDTASPEKLQAEEDDDDDGGDDEELDGKKRREKKLKLVLRLPSNQKSSLNSGSGNSSASDSNAEEDNAASNSSYKKRKINAIGDGSRVVDAQKGNKSSSGTSPSSNTLKGATKLDSGPSTPLPDKKLLLFILDRLQKKDTYGVFSEPVDPKELPDYHEIIEHPMDFGTVRKKVSGGTYANLEQFEKDVYLICSNAMQYNSPDTIYFRQARSIQELAKKNFENLRQDSDDNEPEPKVVRRGRPPTKNLKKPLGRPSLERAGSEFSDATLATGGENTSWSNYDLRKGPHLLDKSGMADPSGRFHGFRNYDVHTSWLADSKLEKNDDFTGSMLRGNSKHGKKLFVLDENRRNTYVQSNPSTGRRDSSVFTTFDGERKQLMPVGIQSEFGYARSLARFATNLGSVAWKVAAKRIERSLPAGVKFGPGWVGENDVTQNKPLLLPSQSPGQPPLPQSISDLANSSSAATATPVESKRHKLTEKPEGENSSDKRVSSATSTLDAHISKPLPLSTTTSSSPLANRPSEPLATKAETVEGSKPRTGFNVLSSNSSAIRPRPSFQVRPGPMIHPGVNGYNGMHGFNLPAHMGKLIGAARPAGLDFQSSQMINPMSRTNTNFVHPANANSTDSEGSKFSENRSTVNSGVSLPNPGNEASGAPSSGLRPRPSWQGLSPRQKFDSGLSPQQKSDSVPPDLNVMFQSPGSPSSSRVDSTQPDLALQL